MAKQAGQKLKLLYLLDMLREQTDEERGLSLSQIQTMLQKQMRLEKQTDGISFYDDFASLGDYVLFDNRTLLLFDFFLRVARYPLDASGGFNSFFNVFHCDSFPQ